jgi:hypothetical protein
MKYIISESRYNKMVSDYLDGIEYTEYIDDREIFLGTPNSESGEYLYEKDSGELLINPDIITMLTKFFGMDDFKAYDSIENWFGKKYDVYIDTTRPWDW